MVNPHAGAFKHVSVSLTEIMAAGGRLEASVFNIEARQARELIKECGWKSKPLTDACLIVSASYPGRFKRNYVSKTVGLPFILPSQITDINPMPTKWIYGLKNGDLATLSVGKGDVLLTRSGTVGQCSIAGKSLDGKVMSDDLIRIVPHSKYRGYLYIFLTSKTGQMLLTTSNYGAVIQHIEPEHLSEIRVPIADDATVAEINDAVIRSFDLRDESNNLINQAQQLIIKSIGLPKLDDLTLQEYKPKSGVINYSVPLNKMDGRFDGSYHHPVADAIETALNRLIPVVTTIADQRVSKEVILPGRFKRIYVEEGFGVPFLGGKEIGSLDPRTGKNLSLQGHGERIKDQLTIRQNQVMITCSGTIGRINMAPKHWAGWTSSQHVIRIEPKAPWMAGYLYAWLSTEYGRELIRRFTYGSVVDEVSDDHIGSVTVPLLDEPLMREIGQLVLDANEKRYQAFTLEQQAINVFNMKVLRLQ